jgi:hypothetical protein
VFAETPSEALKRRRLEYPDLTQLVEQAQSTPPEFAANTLLRVAESPALRDKAWKRELLDQAFASAGGARNPVKRRVMPDKSANGSRQQMIGLAANLGLDRLTLQADAVKTMLTVNAKHARELFGTIPQPTPARLHCDDALLDDPSSYFSTAAAVAAVAFTDEERRRDDLVLFLNERVQRITSPVEIAPAARMIAASSARLTAVQSGLLVVSLAAALQRLEGDDRSFSSSLPAISQDIAKLPGEALTEAYRQFLVKNLTGARCADGTGEETVQKAVADFNGRSSAGIAPLKVEDLKASKIEGKASLDRPNMPDESYRQRMVALMMGQGSVALTDEQKNTAKWREEFADLLRDVEGITPASGEKDAVFYYRKGSCLYALLVVTPPGEARDKVLQEYIAFVKASNLQQENLIEWFSNVESLVSATRSLNEGEYRKMLDVFEYSGHSVLSIYARLQKLLPSAPSWARNVQ